MVQIVNAIQTNDASNLVKKAFFYINFKEIQDKIPDHDKYIVTNDFNKFPDALFHERVEQAKLVATNDLNTVEQSAITNEKKIEN